MDTPKKVTRAAFVNALVRAQEQIELDGIHLVNLSWERNPIQLGVSCGGMGTLSAFAARRFAAQIAKAAEIAETFPYNGYIITCAEQ